MIDIGFSKILIIGVVALIVIGPERLPATAKAIGILWSRFQHYMFKLKQEVNQHISLEEINKLKSEAIEASNAIQSNLSNIQSSISSDLHTNLHSNSDEDDIYAMDKHNYQPKLCHGRYSWRLKKLNMPLWYKHKNGIKGRVQSGSARMKRFRYRENSKKYFIF
jgi:sec-independent protein translocase protein TatB